MTLRNQMEKAQSESVPFWFIGKDKEWKLFVGSDGKPVLISTARKSIPGAQEIMGSCTSDGKLWTFVCEKGGRADKEKLKKTIHAEWEQFHGQVEVEVPAPKGPLPPTPGDKPTPPVVPPRPGIGTKRQFPTPSQEEVGELRKQLGEESQAPPIRPKRQFDQPSGQDIAQLQQDVQEAERIKQELMGLTDDFRIAVQSPAHKDQVRKLEQETLTALTGHDVSTAQAKLTLLKPAIAAGVKAVGEHKRLLQSPDHEQGKRELGTFATNADARARQLEKVSRFSKGLPALAKMVRDIGTLAAKQPLDLDRVLDQIRLARQFADYYKQDHLLKENKKDDQYNAAEALENDLAQLQYQLCRFPAVDNALAQLKGLPKGDPGLPEMIKGLATLAGDKNLPESVAIAVVEQIGATGDVDLIAQCSSLVGDRQMPLVKALVRHQKKGDMPGILTRLATPEFDTAKPGIGFQRTTGNFVPRVASEFGRTVAHDYLSKAQTKVGAHLDGLDEPLEVDENKLPPKTKDRDKQGIIARNVAKHEAIATDVVDHLTSPESVANLPPEFKAVCSSYYSELAKRNPLIPNPATKEEQQQNADTERFLLSAVGGYVLLQLVNPWLVTTAQDRVKAAERSGSEKELAKAQAFQRSVILQTKVFQNLANGVDFSSKEVYMAPLSGLLKKLQPKMDAFLKQLAGVS